MVCCNKYPRDDDGVIAVQLSDSSDVGISDSSGVGILCGIVDPVCRTREIPVLPDAGRCSPRRLKIDCEAPTIPVPSCGDYDFTIIYTPGGNPPFSVISILRDQNCNPILDEDDDEITTTTT